MDSREINRRLTDLERDYRAVSADLARFPARVAMPGGGSGSDGTDFRVTGAAQDGTNKRWVYTGRKVIKSTAGYGGWADDPNDSTVYSLYSEAEDQNGATGTYGNGVTSTDLAAVGGTFAMVRIPDATRVFARPKAVVATGAIEWWIVGHTTTPTGACA